MIRRLQTRRAFAFSGMVDLITKSHALAEKVFQALPLFRSSVIALHRREVSEDSKVRRLFEYFVARGCCELNDDMVRW